MNANYGKPSKARRERYVALINGDKWYFTGKECKNGHVSPRRSDTGGCSKCIAGARNLPKSVTEFIKSNNIQCSCN